MKGRLLCAAVLACTLRSEPGTALEAKPEYTLKAQILVELLPYVDRRPELAATAAPLMLGVFGRSPFGSHLDDYARGRTFRGRPIQVRYGTRLQDLAACEVLFICRSEAAHVDQVVAWAKGRRILTVADDLQAAAQGVMINLLMEGRYVRLAVNPDTASQEGLFFSSQLLRNARILGRIPAPSETRRVP